MTALFGLKRPAIVALGLAVLLTPTLAAFPARTFAISSFADPAFMKVWNHCDKPVQDGVAVRSWMWGPTNTYTGYEQYMQGPGGQHLVAYFDKSRMEINDPSGDRNSEWFITNGLLVVDMISGRIQVGDNQYLQMSPAAIPVAGDKAASVNAPTYAALRNVASLNGDHRAANRVGQPVSEGLGPTGNIGAVNNLAGYTRYAAYEPTLGHNIADIFWSFMNARGTTYHTTGYMYNDLLVDWVFAMGYPITEPYWININVGGQERWVLMQAFQRRILTYSPQNPAGWQVEMGNVGLAYYDWRYAQAPAPAPTPTPTPKPAAPASITLDPSRGDTNTTIYVTGWNFPPNTAVMIGVEKASANYFRNIGTVGTKSNGTFGAKINLPSDAVKLGTVTVTATANNGAVRATAPFEIAYSASIEVSPPEVVPNGSILVQGDGFPPNTSVNLGLLYSNNTAVWLTSVKTGSRGEFSANMSVGNVQVGSTFRVIAAVPGGQKVTADVGTKVIAQPGLQVWPNSGPAGVNVTLSGTNWPPYRQVSLGLRGANTQATAWLPQYVAADGAGNFTANVYIYPDYAGAGQVLLIAAEPVSTVSVQVPYYVTVPPTPTPTPAPKLPTVAVNPSVLAIGQIASVTGANWQAGASVMIGVGRPGHNVEEWLTSAVADGARNFATTITLGSRWQNAGQLVITAVIPNNKSATAIISVVPTTGRIVPMGLPVAVDIYKQMNGLALVKVTGTGWQPSSVVHVNIVSADGALNSEITQAVADSNGAFKATFYAAAAWAGRPDLGIRSTTLDGIQYSLRYLPVTSATKVPGTSNIYNIVGANWPASTSVDVIIYYGDEGVAKSGAQTVQTITTDGNGYFNFNMPLPRIPGNPKTDFELKTRDGTYNAAFQF